MTRLLQALSIRTGENRMASLVIGIMLFTAMGAAVGGTGIEALFFARFGVEYLPYMFVGLGITSMLISFGTTAALGRIPRRVLYVAIPLFIAIVLVLARIALFSELRWLYPALWLGKEILNSLTAILIWGIAGAVCDTRQAKRLFPLFNASRILGQVIGGFVTGVLVNTIGVENLLIFWAGTLLLAFVFSRSLLRGQQVTGTTPRSRQRQPPLIQEMQRGYQYVRKSRLMRWVSLAAILFSVLYFSISLPFSRAATEQYPSEAQLASFLGLFNGLSTAAAFLASLFLANRLFVRLGIMLCILIFPVIYLVGFASLALLPVFSIVVLFRFTQMLWLSGVADPAYQTMFNVVPPERRDQVRTFIDGVPSQAGTFIAGSILIFGERALAPQQLYIVGLTAAAICIVAIYQARKGYNDALVEALKAGNPHLFYSEEQPFGGFRQDVTAIRAALDGLRDRNPIVRRVSAEILGHLSLPEAEEPLRRGLSDPDALVRASCLRGLAQANARAAQEKVPPLLQDDDADVRYEAVNALTALTSDPAELADHIIPLPGDKDPHVSTRVASTILRLPVPFGRRAHDKALIEKAKSFLRYTAVLGDLVERQQAVMAMGHWGDAEAFEFLVNELRDPTVPVMIRRAILTAVAGIHSEKALPYLIAGLGHEDASIRDTCASLLGQMGESAMESVLQALQDPALEAGALLALQHLPVPPHAPVEDYARAAIARAMEYHHLARGVRSEAGAREAEDFRENGIGSQVEVISLLAESLQKKSDEHGARALRAMGLLGDRETMKLAIDILNTRNSAHHATVLEMLESANARWRKIIQPLTRLWEQDNGQVSAEKADWQRLLEDDDPWIRDCAMFAARPPGETSMDHIATLSLMERILFLKRVPLFATLSPADLKQVAAIAQEETFGDGATMVSEGDIGDVLFILVSGEVSVTSMKDQREIELARRKAGDFVGETALISREPRNATLTAIGDVRALCIDQKSFEALLRDRPDVSLAVIQVISGRLRESDRKLHNQTNPS